MAYNDSLKFIHRFFFLELIPNFEKCGGFEEVDENVEYRKREDEFNIYTLFSSLTPLLDLLLSF